MNILLLLILLLFHYSLANINIYISTDSDNLYRSNTICSKN